jgi:hypothetical protein
VTLATVSDVVVAAPAAFVLGLIVGWVVSQRYAIVRKNSDAP